LQHYNRTTFILKYLDNKNFVKNFFNSYVFLNLLFIILCNLSNFRKANKVFINSYAFGHSITESSIFFHEYGHRGVCISVGNRKNRNKYLKSLFKPYILIHFWLPSFSDINIYHALRLRVHDAISLYFEKSKLMRVMLGKNHIIIQRDILCDRAAARSLQLDYRFTEEDATSLVDKFNKDFIKVEQGAPLASLYYLTQQKTFINHNMSAKMIKLNHKFLNRAQSFTKSYAGGKIKICTIILRKSWKPWSGLGIASYTQAIEYLISKNYLVNIVGDLQDLHRLENFKLLDSIYYSKQYNLNSKIFQILSVINSDFCIGDQSGLQALVHFLDKRNLIINSVPFSQLQYNSVMLPRIWLNENGSKANLEEHSGHLLHRYHSFLNSEGNLIYPTYYSPQTILDAVINFVEAHESNNNSTWLRLNNFTRQEPQCMTIFSKNTSYSPILYKELKF
jgi:putative glycosyltransferase (TIGR04372 family)